MKLIKKARMKKKKGFFCFVRGAIKNGNIFFLYDVIFLIILIQTLKKRKVVRSLFLKSYIYFSY